MRKPRSLGAQSFQPDLLSVLERRAGPDAVRNAFYHFRDANFDNISLDLLHGIPGQTTQEAGDGRHQDEVRKRLFRFRVRGRRNRGETGLQVFIDAETHCGVGKLAQESGCKPIVQARYALIADDVDDGAHHRLRSSRSARLKSDLDYDIVSHQKQEANYSVKYQDPEGGLQRQPWKQHFLQTKTDSAPPT